jgi:adenylate cyclase, class 2
MTETEVKILWNGPVADVQALVVRQGYQLTAARVLETDQLFDRSAGELKQSGTVLRLRQAAGLSTITYKGPATRDLYKSREEIEFDVSNPENFVTVLDRLGYQPTLSYQKFRTKFSDPCDPGLVTIDETPMGVFLELEGSKDWIDRAASRLGFPQTAYLTSSYASLYKEHVAKDTQPAPTLP